MLLNGTTIPAYCGGLKYLITSNVLLLLQLLLILISQNTCEGVEVYFPMSSIRVNLPINEKSQSIFSKIPIGQFQVLSVHNNSVATDYIYSLESNDLLRINGTTGEIFIKNHYRKLNATTKFIITAIPRSTLITSNIPHMSLEVNPQKLEDEYCQHLESICFWSAAHYTIMEFNSDTRVGVKFQPYAMGTLNPRAAKYLCPNFDVKYELKSGHEFFALRNNFIYVNASVDYDHLNAKQWSNLTALVACNVQVTPNIMNTYQKLLNITIVDRNDNGPKLQSNKVYNYNLDDPYFKANDSIGDKIIFSDKDSMETNAHLIYTVHNDTIDMVRPVCNGYETDHTEKRISIISCQIIFARNGVLSQTPYCFILEASDKTVDGNVTKSANATICLHTDTNKIHDADRPKALPLRQHHRKYTNIFTSEESMLTNSEGNNNHNMMQSLLSIYPKDVFVYRTAMPYNRITEPEDYHELISKHGLGFKIAEDRSGAFGITSVAGIIYVKDKTALERSPETIYFLNVTWHDTHQRSFVINVHLVDDRPNNASCEFKLKSRSQTCAQVKYQKQCVQFCGLATDGGTCQWRGSNAASFSRSYGSCVPNAKYCPDNVCDPLEELNMFACPQDCTHGNKIVGPHSVNSNRRGILSASGTCTCEDNGKCSCAPLDGDEPKPKRKRKNDAGKLTPTQTVTATSYTDDGDEQGIEVAGFVCGKSCMIVAITCPLSFIVLIVCFIVSRRNLLRKKVGKESLSIATTTTTTGQKHISDGECDVQNGDIPLMQLENNFKLDATNTKWEFDREQLTLDVVLGEGEFGKVMKAYATYIDGVHGKTTVAVKMLKNGANSVEYMALLSEFQLLQEVSHPNVIRLLGACTKGDSPLLIIEYARYGSLRSYLRLSRKIECAGVDFTDGVEPVTVKNILSFAWQICKGMTYLTEIKLVHRDLAARNVLLAEGKICKISDFGLTRDVYEDDAYLKRSRDRVPVKWMAPESLADHVYTTKSDVWAFGILCWELITLAASPYPGIPPQNLYHLLKTGYRMERPENCSEEVYSIVRSCWIDEPNARPSFKYLASQFEKLLGNNAKYIELESNAVSNPIYCMDEAQLASKSQSQTDLIKLTHDLGDPDCLDHLWWPPKMLYDLNDCTNSHDFSNNFKVEFQPPPGYDMPRPLIEIETTEQRLRYENDLRFPLNIRKSMCAGSMTSNSQNGSKSGTEPYAVPVKRGRSYMDMTNKTNIPDNLDNDFEKLVSKTISFRFSSLLNLQEQDGAA